MSNLYTYIMCVGVAYVYSFQHLFYLFYYYLIDMICERFRHLFI